MTTKPAKDEVVYTWASDLLVHLDRYRLTVAARLTVTCRLSQDAKAALEEGVQRTILSAIDTNHSD
jgi:hypothetical protein